MLKLFTQLQHGLLFLCLKNTNSLFKDMKNQIESGTVSYRPHIRPAWFEILESRSSLEWRTKTFPTNPAHELKDSFDFMVLIKKIVTAKPFF